jgi:hypothetical protein
MLVTIYSLYMIQDPFKLGTLAYYFKKGFSPKCFPQERTYPVHHHFPHFIGPARAKALLLSYHIPPPA